jgi:hypothetical protein
MTICGCHNYKAKTIYEKIIRADNLMVAICLDADHEFPAEIQDQKFRFSDKHMR